MVETNCGRNHEDASRLKSLNVSAHGHYTFSFWALSLCHCADYGLFPQKNFWQIPYQLWNTCHLEKITIVVIPNKHNVWCNWSRIWCVVYAMLCMRAVIWKSMCGARTFKFKVRGSTLVPRGLIRKVGELPLVGSNVPHYDIPGLVTYVELRLLFLWNGMQIRFNTFRRLWVCPSNSLFLGLSNSLMSERGFIKGFVH